jgi:hypothetical protein
MAPNSYSPGSHHHHKNRMRMRMTRRKLEDQEEEDYSAASGAYLTCNWRWEAEDANGDSNVTVSPNIIQSCGYLMPDYSSNADGYIGYRTKSVCVYENINATTVACNVTDYRSKSPKYMATCSISELAKKQPVSTACQAQTAWIPIQSAECQECWRRHRHLSATNTTTSTGRLLTSDTCQRCTSTTEKCPTFTFGTTTISSDMHRQDYNGIPWSSTLIETMKSEVAAGNNHVDGSDLPSVMFYDISRNQSSLLAQDFALGMAFDCESGRYLDAALSKQNAMDSGGAWVLGAVAWTLIAAGAALIWLILHRSSGTGSSSTTRDDECDRGERTSRLMQDSYVQPTLVEVNHTHVI